MEKWLVLLYKTMQDWKGDISQLDDICVISVNISI